MKPSSFFAEYERLKQLQLRIIDTNSPNNENCDWGTFIHQSKNAFLCHDSSQLIDCAYCTEGFKLTDCYDCDFCAESELCYQCLESAKLFNCTYCYYCGSGSTDCHFCINVSDCHYCFGCVGLKHKKYCFFNRQLTKTKYFEELKYWQKQPITKIFEELNKVKRRLPRANLHMEHNSNCWGDYCYYSSNCYFCFGAAHNQDSGYLFDSHRNKNCYDLDHSFWSELSYQLIDCSRLYNCSNAYFSYRLTDCDYMHRCQDCKDCLGCVCLKNKKYCILNRQLTKEEYFRKSAEIKKQLGWKI